MDNVAPPPNPPTQLDLITSNKAVAAAYITSMAANHVACHEVHNAAIARQDATIAERDATIRRLDATIVELNARIERRNGVVAGTINIYEERRKADAIRIQQLEQQAVAEQAKLKEFRTRLREYRKEREAATVLSGGAPTEQSAPPAKKSRTHDASK